MAEEFLYGRILKSLIIVNLYRGVSNLKIKINVKLPQLLACSTLSVSGDDRKAARDVKRGTGRRAGSGSQTPLVARSRAAFRSPLLTESLEQAKLLSIVLSVALNGESQSTKTRSNSPFRATETAIHNN